MIYDLIDLSEWKKKNQILRELRESGMIIGERAFRKRVELNNKLFEEHITPKYIAHSQKGYIATNDRNIIIESLKDNNKRAITMLKSNNKIFKALGEDINMNLEME